MRIARSFVFCAAAAFISAGCEVRTEPAQVSVSGDVVVDEPQGEVVQGPGVVAIDVEPDPTQRVYVYDQGYPPGTYLYDNYYYYGGYRYPHDVFVNQYVSQNIRQQRFMNADQNRRQGQVIEEKHRTEFAKTRGVRQARSAAPAAQPRVQEPSRQQEAPRPNVERPANAPAINEEHRAPFEQPQTENKAPANNEEHRATTDHPEGKVNPRDKAGSANEEHKPNVDEPRHEEQK